MLFARTAKQPWEDRFNGNMSAVMNRKTIRHARNQRRITLYSAFRFTLLGGTQPSSRIRRCPRIITILEGGMLKAVIKERVPARREAPEVARIPDVRA